jgi:hypothetical protein
MNDAYLLIKIQKFVAFTAIGASAMRNQGKGILIKAQKFCEKLDLLKYSSAKNESYFLEILDQDTIKLLNNFGLKKRPWGTARKALNLFLRDAFYNYYLRNFYHLEKIEKFLEIPLDRIVTQKLKEKTKKGFLPTWKGLKNLMHKESDLFQAFAKKQAMLQGMSKIHLDAILWTKNR